ncbi:hypothetical protein AABM38_20445 [Heyndrickxia sp. MSNUG]|uniref:phage tail protein n=1 Tax=Heyndrickxia sp. MSNUG TaxID=3136677 RepID=UPI003C304B59
MFISFTKEGEFMELFKLFGTIALHDGEARQGLENIDRQGQNTGNSVMNTFKKVGGVLAAAFAVEKVAAFGKAAIESAASAQALQAQFEQVFGADAGEARGVIENLGKDFGMLPNRIKPAMTQMTSMFKGLGLETGEAMDMASSAVTMTADAAAFYDKSFEDANSALNSFIKGNYEGGEAIGLFGSETQISAWASKELGVQWKGLDEAGKQIARLEYAKAMQESAGATGQAARESNSLENQLGNLKQAWEDIKAKFGAPILEPAVNGLKLLAEKIAGFDTAPITNGIQKVVDVGKVMVGYFKEYILPIFTQFFDWIQANMPTIRATAEKVFNGIKEYAKFLWQFYKENLLPILTDLYNWIQGHMPTIRATAETAFNKITEVVRNAWAFFKDNLLPILVSVYGWVQANMPQIKSIIETTFRVIKNVVEIAWGIFENLLLPALKALWKWIEPHMPEIKKAVKENMDKVVETIQTVVDIFEAVTDAIKTAIDWLGSWNDKPAKKKTVEVEERRTTGGIAGGVPNHYVGTSNFRGGATWVGEHGPELVSLPKGTKIHSANDSRDMVGSGSSIGNVYVSISAKDVMEFNNLVDWMNKMPQIARKHGEKLPNYMLAARG